MRIRQLTRGIQSTLWVCRLFYKFGRQHNAALRQWYSFGVAVAAMLGMSVIFMLLQDVWLAIAWIKEVCLQNYLCIECPSNAAMQKQMTFMMTLAFVLRPYKGHTPRACSLYGLIRHSCMEVDAYNGFDVVQSQQELFHLSRFTQIHTFSLSLLALNWFLHTSTKCKSKAAWHWSASLPDALPDADCCTFANIHYLLEVLRQTTKQSSSQTARWMHRQQQDRSATCINSKCWQQHSLQLKLMLHLLSPEHLTAPATAHSGRQ